MKGFIYVIRSHQTDDVYYGSTKQELSRRMSGHRRDFKNHLEGKSNISSGQILKYDDAYIELIEEVEYENRSALLAREGFYIRNNKCVNKVIVGRTHKEYLEDNKEQIKEQRKQYGDKHKEELKLYQEEHKEQRKEYLEKNKEHINERMKLYRENHKEKMKEYAKRHRLKNKAPKVAQGELLNQ